MAYPFSSFIPPFYSYHPNTIPVSPSFPWDSLSSYSPNIPFITPSQNFSYNHGYTPHQQPPTPISISHPHPITTLNNLQHLSEQHQSSTQEQTYPNDFQELFQNLYLAEEKYQNQKRAIEEKYQASILSIKRSQEKLKEKYVFKRYAEKLKAKEEIEKVSDSQNSSPAESPASLPTETPTIAPAASPARSLVIPQPEKEEIQKISDLPKSSPEVFLTSATTTFPMKLPDLRLPPPKSPDTKSTTIPSLQNRVSAPTLPLPPYKHHFYQTTRPPLKPTEVHQPKKVLPRQLPPPKPPDRTKKMVGII